MPAYYSDSKAGGTNEQQKQIYGHLNTDQQPDTDEIADKLFDWLDSVDLDHFDAKDEETLDRMLAELDEADPSVEEIDHKESAAKLRHDYERMIELVQAEDRKSAAPVKRPRKAFRRLIPLAAVLVLLGMMVTAHSDVAEKIGRWTSEIFHFSDDAAPRAVITKRPLEEGEEASYVSLEEAVVAFGIEAPVVPKWIPKRFGEPVVTAKNIKMGVHIRSICDANGHFLYISLSESDGIDYSLIEKDYLDAEVIVKKGIEHFVVEDDITTKAIWWNGELECRITGDITKKEMKNIIISLYEENYEE